MAVNKFASMLHKNCHKIIVILVYAVLEWILIFLLLLNSFFSYLITKFANFFGLKPSCTWCSRLDHIFDSNKITISHSDHVCEAHGAEINNLSYCSNHKRLAESKNLCTNCSSSTQLPINEISSTVAFFSWMSDETLDKGEEKRCSCCDEVLSRKVYPPPSMIFKPSWDVLDYIHKKASLSQADLIKHNDDQRGIGKDHQLHSDGCEKTDSFEVQEWNSGQNDDPFWSPGFNEDDESVYLADMLLQNADYEDSDRFICIELIDTPSVSSEQPLRNSSEDGEERCDNEQGLSVGEAYNLANTRFEAQEGSYDDITEKCSGRSILLPETELSVTNGAIVSQFEEKKTSDQDEAKGKRRSPEEGLGLEDCLDGSLGSEVEVVDEYLSRENLKTIIKAQEKTMTALYKELEEERAAAAEAAKETMSMITKVQEEKAAMQMEALQYQRMMEEQAEYDQEALQLLNDLMIKREKEKKELEKELEMCRNKIVDYEAMEMTTMIRRRLSSNDDHSLDLDCDENRFGTNQECSFDDSSEGLGETGEECTGDLMTHDVSLAEFDEERLSILEELKILEAKLLALHDDEEKKSSNSDDNERERVDIMAKKLLPLLDATENGFVDEEYDKTEVYNHSSGMMNQLLNGIETSNSQMLIQEEIGHVYERLQALEEDKDFLKHCIGSMMKGDKGMALVQEILQHLRDLKSVDASARNLAQVTLPDASMIREDQE